MHEWILTSEGQTLAQLVTAQEALGNTVLQQDVDNSRVLVDSPSGGSGLANALVYKGATDCSANPNYPAADAGDMYIVSVAGKIGGASGVSVEAGDSFICKTDGTAAGTQAQRGTAWNVVQGNLAGPIPVKASGAEVDTGTDDVKYVTPKAIADSSLAGGGGVTNSAPSDTIPKTIDGSGNLGASRLTDDGSNPVLVEGGLAIEDQDFYGFEGVAEAGMTMDASQVIVRSDNTRNLFIHSLKKAAIGDAFGAGNGNEIEVDDELEVIFINADNGVRQSAPAASTAGILASGEISFYLDEVANKLMVAVKYSDGTTKTGEVALT